MRKSANEYGSVQGYYQKLNLQQPRSKECLRLVASLGFRDSITE